MPICSNENEQCAISEPAFKGETYIGNAVVNGVQRAAVVSEIRIMDGVRCSVDLPQIQDVVGQNIV